MGLTRERKVFVGMLVLAGAALLIDQGVLRPKSAAAGAPAPGASAPAGLSVLTEVVGQVQAAAAGALPADAASVDLSARLDELRDKLAQASGGPEGHDLPFGTDADDGFALPTDWLPKPVAAEPADDTTTVQPADAGPARTPSGIQLSAVLPSGKGGSAIINGQAVRVGQPIPGQTAWVLAGVRRDAVLLARGDDKRIVRLSGTP
jgi:hypothetical protein